ncbi:MAG: fibronectin type III domain-containing protein [Deltaproteobacteria bacterium]|nr:fibronectin type III domain-containing protein [Deltaproteobacteria bacterium]
MTNTITSLVLAYLTFITSFTSVAFAAVNLPNTTTVSQTGVLIGGGGAGGGQDPGPDDPASKPRTPGQPVLVDRTASSIKLKWTDNSSYEQGYNLYRGAGYSGPWTRIAVFGAVPGNTSVMEYTDVGLPRDTRYYYRVGAYNFFGESFSTPQTFATTDGRIKVNRLQVRLRIANVSDADTDDDVHVSVNDFNMNHGTWLDYGRDDFQRGDDFTFELLPEGVSDLSDINDIFIFKTGSDGMCLAGLSLLVNGGEIYTQDFGATSSTCHWIDGGNGVGNYFVVGRSTLRAHPLWQNFVAPVKISVQKRELGDLVEGIVGNIIHDDISLDLPVYIGSANPYWGQLHDDRAVEVFRRDTSSVRVRFNLGIGLIVDDPSVTIGFAARFTGVCRTATTPPSIRITLEEFGATPRFGVISQALTIGLINLAENTVAAKIDQSLKGMLPQFERDFPIDIKDIACVTPSVDADGNVNFTVTQVPRTSGTTTSGTKVTGTFGTTATKTLTR